MSDEILMTRESVEKLKKEVEELKHVRLPVIIKRIEEAIKMGDLSENAEYHEAKDDQGMTAARIREIESKLQNAKIVENISGGIVSMGSKLVVEDDNGKERELEIVDQIQSDPLKGKISNESPIGAALLGKKVGEIVNVELPAGPKKYTIKKVE